MYTQQKIDSYSQKFVKKIKKMLRHGFLGSVNQACRI